MLSLLHYQNENNCPVPKVNQPIRIALTGSTKSPSLGLTLAIFGKNEELHKIIIVFANSVVSIT